jgi:penicillin-binding protein 2
MFVLDQVKTGDPRLRWVAAGMLMGMLLLVGGLWYVQIVSGGRWENSKKIQSFRNVRVPAVRGKILDRNGQLLAENRPRYVVNLYLEELRKEFLFEYTNSVKREFVARTKHKPNRKQAIELEEFARYRVVSNIVWKVSSAILAQPLIVNSNAFARHYKEQLAMPMPIVTDLNPQQIGLFMGKAADLPGVELEVEPYRYYPHTNTAAHVIGYVQQDMQPEDDTEYLFRYRLPDYMGKSGIENGYDADLRGHAGGKAILVNNIGYRQKQQMWLSPEPGKNVRLTLDLKLQQTAEAALLRAGPETRGAAIVLDPRNGDILVMASAPSYDLNMFVRTHDYTKEDWERLNDPYLIPQYNRALQGAYHPGSIIKILVALTCFEAGVMTEDDTLDNPGYFMLGRRRIDDLAPKGIYDFKNAFKRSSNTYFIEYGLRAGLDRIADMAQRFNLGDRTGAVPSGQEARGYFPSVGQRLKRDGTRWMEGDTANLCIGQGEILVTPLQMTVMTAAVANGGKVVKPRLVSQIEAQDSGEVEILPGANVERELKVNPKNLDIVRRAMLADVEEENGTGTKAFIPGMRICGKTGTAQIRNAHGQIDHVTWFVSFSPFEAPKYVVLVMVETGRAGYGGTICAPMVKEIYKAIQKIEEQQSEKERRGSMASK